MTAQFRPSPPFPNPSTCAPTHLGQLQPQDDVEAHPRHVLTHDQRRALTQLLSTALEYQAVLDDPKTTDQAAWKHLKRFDKHLTLTIAAQVPLEQPHTLPHQGEWYTLTLRPGSCAVRSAEQFN